MKKTRMATNTPFRVEMAAVVLRSGAFFIARRTQKDRLVQLRSAEAANSRPTAWVDRFITAF